MFARIIKRALPAVSRTTTSIATRTLRTDSTAYLHGQLAIARQNGRANAYYPPSGNQRLLSTLVESKKKIYVVHLGQVHELPYLKPELEKRLKDLNIFKEIVSCQLEIAHYLLKQKSPIVVEESIAEDLVPDLSPTYLAYAKRAKDIFPLGLPFSPSQLNEEQSMALYKLGGPIILFYLGYLKKLYKAIHEEQANAIYNELKPYHDTFLPYNEILAHKGHLICGAREREALLCCKEAALMQPEQEVTIHLVYGLAHKISEAIEKFSDKQIFFSAYYDFDKIAKQKRMLHRQAETRFFPLPLGSSPKNDFPLAMELKKLIDDLGIEELFTSAKINIATVARLKQEKPWVLEALRYHHICEALLEEQLLLSQLEQLSQGQLELLLKSKYKGRDLKEKVLSLVPASSSTLGPSL